MATLKKERPIRRSISLQPGIHRRIQQLAQNRKVKASRVLEDLVEAGLEAKEAERRRFFELAARLRATNNPAELRQIKRELARLTFGN